jgi:hypothetical protein
VVRCGRARTPTLSEPGRPGRDCVMLRVQPLPAFRDPRDHDLAMQEINSDERSLSCRELACVMRQSKRRMLRTMISSQ